MSYRAIFKEYCISKTVNLKKKKKKKTTTTKKKKQLYYSFFKQTY